MILNRLGNKKKLATDIYSHFPIHRSRIDLFFGAGGLFFNTPLAQYNFANDKDDDVVNLFMLHDRIDELAELLRKMPISHTLFNHWKINKEIDPIRKALRFLMLSNFSYMGKGNMLRFSADNPKQQIIDQLDNTFKKLENVKFFNHDFRDVLDKISFSKGVLSKSESFVYLDPEYYQTDSNYSTKKQSLNDLKDCFALMHDCGIRSALSEFNHPKVIELAKKHDFNVIFIGERHAMKCRKTEVLITNYKPSQLDLFKD